MTNYIIHYDIAGLIILITVMFYFFYRKNMETAQTKIFSFVMFVAVFTDILDIVSSIIIQLSEVIPLWINYFINILYLSIFNITPIVYYWYICVVTKSTLKLKGKNRWIKLVPAFISISLIVTTGFTKKIFYFDENGNYTHGSWNKLLYVFAIFYIVKSLWHSYRSRAILSKRQLTSIYFYTSSVIIALIIQAIYPPLLLAHFAFAVSVLLMYLALENPNDYTDKKLGIFNSLAFNEIVIDYIENNSKFQTLVVQVDGLEYVNETLGDLSSELIIKQISEFLEDVVEKKSLYIIGETQFAIVANSSEKNWDILEKKIYERFRKPFIMEGGELPLTAHMCMVKYPDNVKNRDTVMQMIEYSIQKARTLGEENIVYANEEILEQGRRENKVIQVMKQAVRDKAFEVYYQPIFSVEKECFTSAEALIRLYDKELGFISPDEFIPLAEKNGMILDIGEFVFREVCKFIKSQELWKKGIEFIDVNLSVVQCMQEKLHETLIGIMDEFELEYKRINLEITETAAVISSETLQKNMEKLIDKGIKFSLDDYGTGFSNTSNLINYKFHTIKLDKSMVWSAMEDEKAMCALKHTIAMVKDMDMELVAEGVENQEQANELARLGCDFFQGFHYSRPVPENDFCEKLLKKSS